MGIENGMYGGVVYVEDSIDRVAPEKDSEGDRLTTIAENVEVGYGSCVKCRSGLPLRESRDRVWIMCDYILNLRLLCLQVAGELGMKVGSE